MALDSLDVYRWLKAGAGGPLCEGFDVHVVACALALALSETAQGLSLVQTSGLTAAELCELAQLMFPHAQSVFERVGPDEAPARAADEACLQELLFRGASGGDRLEYFLSCMVARRAQRPNHLWQDLGLRNRRELSWLMDRHFEPIAARNKQDMKWKKFLYRMICRDEGFGICTAPSCEECDDYASCFGDEGSEGLLAGAQPDPKG